MSKGASEPEEDASRVRSKTLGTSPQRPVSEGLGPAISIPALSVLIAQWGLRGAEPAWSGTAGLEPERRTGLRAGARLLIVHDLQTWPASQTAS